MDLLPNELLIDILSKVIKDRIWLVIPLRTVCVLWHDLVNQMKESNMTQVYEAMANCNTTPLTDEAMLCTCLASDGYVGLMDWSIKQGWKIDSFTSDQAAEFGQLNVLKWLKENGHPCNGTICNYAAKNGHLDIIQWAHLQGYQMNKFTCANAAEGGHLEILRWLREHDCPWDELTCQQAANNGHLEVLQWARDQGCPWNEWHCKLACLHFVDKLGIMSDVYNTIFI